jgi:hypothetical protein
MTGPGSGGDIVSAQTNALEGAQTAIVQLLSKARSMSQMGQSLPICDGWAMSASPPLATGS